MSVSDHIDFDFNENYETLENDQDLAPRKLPVRRNDFRSEPVIDGCSLIDWDVGKYFGEEETMGGDHVMSMNGVSGSMSVREGVSLVEDGSTRLGNNGEKLETDEVKDASEVDPSDVKDLTNVVGSGPVDGIGTSEKVHVVVLGMPANVGNENATWEYKSCLSGPALTLLGETYGKRHVVVLGMPANSFDVKVRRVYKQRKTRTVTMENNNVRRSSRDFTRHEDPEAAQPSTNQGNTQGSTERRGRKKKTGMGGKSHNEYARIRKHLSYLLHRIQNEQNLLDAYSSEGWRGQSVEKLRPEKELQRAKADINRSKLKIRNLFQHLDSLSSEGKIPESVFDSEGLIDSEDIFCAKCGTRDFAIDNDIILCDGACDRGFHQCCLEPPLRTEEIPPGDEGWLCPACDCKVDCLKVLNDSHGTKLFIQDSWEKVFPGEAAAAVAVDGSEHDDVMGLPSDDSEDNDYNPDGTNDVEFEGNESSSNESGSAKSDSSDFSSASEDLKAVCGGEQYPGFPSDDFEDDAYNPDAVNVNEHNKHGSFKSGSEDLGAAADETPDNHEPPLSLLEQAQGTDDMPSVSGRRQVERPDYKKLYDETYGNASSNSSDDEVWADMDTTRKGKGSSTKGVSDSLIAGASAPINGGGGGVGTPKRRGRKKLNLQAANGSPSQLTEPSQKIDSSSKSMKRLPPNRLGAVITQKLYESFKKQHFPDPETKEELAEELGLTPVRVNKWFAHARWTFNHHPARLEASMAAAALYCSTLHNVPGDATGNASVNGSTAVLENCHADLSKEVTNEADQKASTPKRSSKRKKNEDDPLPQSRSRETSLEDTETDDLQISEAQHGGVQRTRRKSKA